MACNLEENCSYVIVWWIRVLCDSCQTTVIVVVSPLFVTFLLGKIMAEYVDQTICIKFCLQLDGTQSKTMIS